LKKTPSLTASLNDPDWWADAWQDARMEAHKETGIEYDVFPEACPWAPGELVVSG
jgi:hypothetical protein